MTAVMLIVLTFLFAVIAGAILLIQMGGWLPTLVAILFIMCFMLMSSALIILGIMDFSDTRKRNTRLTTTNKEGGN